MERRFLSTISYSTKLIAPQRGFRVHAGNLLLRLSLTGRSAIWIGIFGTVAHGSKVFLCCTLYCLLRKPGCPEFCSTAGACMKRLRTGRLISVRPAFEKNCSSLLAKQAPSVLMECPSCHTRPPGSIYYPSVSGKTSKHHGRVSPDSPGNLPRGEPPGSLS